MAAGGQQRYFTLQQANAIVVAIRPLVAEILSIRKGILERQPELWPVLSQAAGNGGSKAASQIASEFARLEEFIHAVQESGALLRDLNTGLVDFLARRQGEDIYLCWQYDEASILFWHSLEAGFAGRQPVYEDEFDE